jgi:hypothetical protein
MINEDAQQWCPKGGLRWLAERLTQVLGSYGKIISEGSL